MWTIPRGVAGNLTANFTVTIGAVKEAAMLLGGGGQAFAHRPITADDLDALGTFASGNYSLQLLVDASTRATRRVRPTHSDLYDLMEILDNTPLDLPSKRSEDRRVPFYGGIFAAVPGDRNAGVQPWEVRPPSKKYNETVERFSMMMNLTGQKQHQTVLSSDKTAPAFEYMLDEIWDGCNAMFDPIVDPANRKMRASINATLQGALRRGVNNLSAYYISFGDEVQVALVPSNATSLPPAFARCPPSRFQPPGTVLGAQEIPNAVNPMENLILWKIFGPI